MKSISNYVNHRETLSWLSNYFQEIYGVQITIDLSTNKQTYEIKYKSNIFARVSILDKEITINDAEIIAYESNEPNLPHVNRLYCFKSSNEKLASKEDDKVLNIHQDCIAFMICMLSRLEEQECDQLDVHERYISNDSWSERFNFTSIPVVDHWADYIMHALSSKINEKIEPIKKYGVHISHDVDVPFHLSGKNKVKRYFRSVLGSLYRREFHRAEQLLKSVVNKYDIFDTFDFLMNISEKVNEKSTFNFIPDNTSDRWDADYRLEDTKIRDLMKKIISRGHKIGLHCSYNCYQNDYQINLERDLLQSSCQKYGYKENVISSRMHYLRWESWGTAKKLSNSGIALDTTLGFADKIGFRSGTARPYCPLDLISKKTIKLKILPLHIMDVTLWGYMKLKKPSDMMIKSKSIIDRVKEVNGTLNILWHNSDLVEKWKKELYQEIIHYAKK